MTATLGGYLETVPFPYSRGLGAGCWSCPKGLGSWLVRLNPSSMKLEVIKGTDQNIHAWQKAGGVLEPTAAPDQRPDPRKRRLAFDPVPVPTSVHWLCGCDASGKVTVSDFLSFPLHAVHDLIVEVAMPDLR